MPDHMLFEGCLDIVNKGREVPGNHALKLVDNKNKPLCKHAQIEVIIHNKFLSDFTLSVFPPDFDPRLVSMALRRAADKHESMILPAVEYQNIEAVPGEVISIEGLDHIVAGILPGHEHPTVVSDWTAPNDLDVEMKMMHAGWDKTAMWEKMIANNRPLMKHGVKTLFGTIKDKGVIIAGSGPSLQVEQLKGVNQDKWDIIACNDAYRLLDGKAKYFFLSEAEAKEKWWSKISSKTSAILSAHSHPEAGKQAWNAKFWFVSFPYKSVVKGDAELRGLGELHEQLNCTMSALHLAYRMGYRKIVLVGCDFAYTGGESHLGEKADHHEVIYANAKDVSGGMVMTDKVLSLQARCHEAACYFLVRAGLEVTNCTEGGILTGMRCKPLGEVLNGA